MIRSRRTRALAILSASMLAAIGCQPKNEYVEPPPPAVDVAMPDERPVIDYIEFTGATRPVSSVELRARVNGYLEEIHFEDGATVEKDQLLFTIEQAPFKTKLEMARAELQKAKAEQELAESELRRLRSLVRRDAGTMQELDIKQAERDGAAATVASAEASLDDSQLQLGYTEVRAPIAGRIGRHLIDVGNLVQAEQTPLATIESIDPVFAYFTVSEGELLDLRRERGESAAAAALGAGEVLELSFGGEDGYPHRGTLDFTDLGVDPGTGTLQLRGIFPNADGDLLPGLFVRLRTAVGSPKPRLLVPERALGVDQQGDYVLIVNDEDTVEYRSVTLGRAIEGMRVVSKGLDGNEWVVVNGVQFARPGAPVDPKRGDEATAPEVAGSEAEAASAAPEVVEPAAVAETAASPSGSNRPR